MSNYKVLIAEDDEWYSKLLEYHVSLNEQFTVDVAKSGAEVIKKLKQAPDIITLDYSLPDYDGKRLLEIIQQELPNTEVVIISGQEDVKTAISLLANGAYDYIVKDEDTKDRLWKTLLNILEKKALIEKVEELQSEVEQKFDFGKTIIGKSSSIKDLFGLLTKAANSAINVSVTGETGTGKEVVAKAIHFNSDRKKEPFVPVNVSAIPKELVESELFGYEKGAFTGATQRKIGKFELAGKGTLFLDELGEMDENMQAKLLRVLQEKELSRVGGNDTIPIKCRIICATHKNLQEEVRKGNFRQDLFYRILGLPIELPALRNRKDDIIVLAKHFIKLAAKDNGTSVRPLSDEAIDKLMAYHFPGNVRELKAIIDLAMVLSDDNKIAASDIRYQQVDPMNELSLGDATLREYNLKIIDYYLNKYNNDVRKVAAILDIGKSTIYRMLKEKES
jgi:DNA-binding NtrC family response regulator